MEDNMTVFNMKYKKEIKTAFDSWINVLKMQRSINQ